MSTTWQNGRTLERVVDDAQHNGFWKKVVEAFPEVKSGDMDPPTVFAFDEACKKAVRSWLWGNAPQIEAGDRYRLRHPAERDGVHSVPAGETGTVTAVNEDQIQLRLDHHFRHLDEWDNELYWHDNDYCDELPAVFGFLAACERIPEYEPVPTSLAVVACGRCGAVVRQEDCLKHTSTRCWERDRDEC